MIKLHSHYNGEPIWVNPDHITHVWIADDDQKLAGIQSVADNKEMIVVKESPEEVVSKLMELRLESQAVNSITRVLELAGLK